MGLLKVGFGAAASVLADQWREYFYSESIPTDVLVVKGQQRKSKRGFNTKGSDNLISNGSIIAVNEGQAMMIVDQGQIVEFSSEPGEFVFDSSTEPSIFYGNLGDNLKRSFDAFVRRVSFGGDTGKDQRVYFFNTKEITGNKYGTPTPVPFRVVDQNIGLDIDISIRCHGEYSFKLIDPILFYKNVSGNVDGEFRRDQIEGQLRSELLTAMQPAFAKISAAGVRYSALPGHTMEIADALNEVLSGKWQETRGIRIIAFGINSVKASEEDENMIKELQRNAVFRNPNMAAAHLTGAQADAMQHAAQNEGGAFVGFAGMNMAANAGGMNTQNLFEMGQQPQHQQPQPSAPSPAPSQPSAGSWTCSCGTSNTGKFCSNCGSAQPAAPDTWTCSCGTENKGKFCSNCGSGKPTGAPSYKCDKCGWVPEGNAIPKFCPECGDVFDENDRV